MSFEEAHSASLTDNLSSNLSNPLDSKPNADFIQQKIIHRICFLDYLPGCQLKESELAEEFGVSRTPVRDAISRIKHLGLVETRNGVGTVVVALSNQQIADVYEMRMHLATLIGSVSAKPIAADVIQQVKALYKQAIQLQKRFISKQYVELNHQLQNIIATLIGNQFLGEYWRQTYYQAASTWYQISQLAQEETSAAFVQELKELISALEKSDLNALGLVQRIHIGYGYQRIQAHLFDKPISD